MQFLTTYVQSKKLCFLGFFCLTMPSICQMVTVVNEANKGFLRLVDWLVEDFIMIYRKGVGHYHPGLLIAHATSKPSVLSWEVCWLLMFPHRQLTLASSKLIIYYFPYFVGFILARPFFDFGGDLSFEMASGDGAICGHWLSSRGWCK